jgi:hypothetical protein
MSRYVTKTMYVKKPKHIIIWNGESSLRKIDNKALLNMRFVVWYTSTDYTNLSKQQLIICHVFLRHHPL